MTGLYIAAGLTAYCAVLAALAHCMTGDTHHTRRRATGHAVGPYRRPR
jgi:hypothetical protein